MCAVCLLCFDSDQIADVARRRFGATSGLMHRSKKASSVRSPHLPHLRAGAFPGRLACRFIRPLQLTCVIVGALIIVFLVLEPNGQARLWQISKQS
jgi:hypothetical protein